MPPPKTQHIELDKIRIDGGTQSRVAIHEPTVADYAELLHDGKVLPPLVVYFDGADYWLADGFHRYHAARRTHQIEFPCTVLDGTRRDAILYSVGANSKHGLRRTNADKRKAVEMMLRDEEWAKWSDREIARRCGVSATMVGEARSAICPNLTDAPRTVERGGSTYEFKPRPRPAPDEPAPRPEPSRRPLPADPEPVVVRDGRGEPVDDEKVAEALGEVHQFKALINEVHDLKRRIVALAAGPAGAEIRHQEIERELKNVVAALRFAIPYTACPFMPNCARRGGCKHCGGRRWLTEEAWKRLPEEVKKWTTSPTSSRSTR